MRTFTLTALLLLACTKADVRGKPCTQDADCGSGYDCYSSKCTSVCSSQSECRPEETCQRYRCIASASAPKLKTAPAAAPPVPDTTAAEIRAMRREMELIRRQQDKILKRLEASAH